MSQWWRAVGNTVFDLIGPRFKPQTSRCIDERVTTRPTAAGIKIIEIINFFIARKLCRPFFGFI